MPLLRITLFLLILTFSTALFAQEKLLTKKEIINLVHQANESMISDNFEKSLIESRNTLKHSIRIKNNSLIANSYNIIASNFYGLLEFDKALYYYKKGLIYAQKVDNYTLINQLYNNLGNVYCFDKKQYKKGIYYYKKSLVYSKKADNWEQIVFTKLNITWAYFDIGYFNEGYPYLEFVNKHHKKHGNESTIVALNMLNGMYYGAKNNPEKATQYFENAIKLGTEGQEKLDLSYSYEEYSKFLQKKGDYKKAFENLQRFNSITNILNNEEKIKKANAAGMNLEIDEYKREIDTIEAKQNELLETQLRNRKISIVIISLLLLTIVLFYFLFQNTKLKQNNKLKDIQSKIQQNIINASVNGQEMERKKIAAFLHDNISALLSSAGMHLNVFTSQNQTSPQEIIKTKSILEEAHDKVRDLSHELMPALLVRFGLFYALEDLCEKNSNSVVHFAYESTIPTKIRYNEEFEMKIYFIITELLNNIIKHSQASKATVKIQENDQELLIHISDNGKGFDTRKANVIEGFGLNQIRARIDNMHGSITIDSKRNQGTSVALTVPIVPRN
jgi:two-component system NarL family sensor kinase